MKSAKFTVFHGCMELNILVNIVGDAIVVSTDAGFI